MDLIRSEQETFDVLKGLTREEAERLFQTAYSELNNNSNGLVPISDLKLKLDPILKPYGWSFEKIFNISDAS